MDFTVEAKKLALETVSLAKKSKKISAFCISCTSNVRKNKLFFTPIRVTPYVVCANVILFSKDEARKIVRVIDGLVDIIFVDAEEKIKNLSNLANFVQKEAKESKVFSIKINDITAESADALVAQYFKDLKNKKAAIIGCGNIGSKIALKLVERGAKVFITRQDENEIKCIADGLNLIKPKNIPSNFVGMTDNYEAVRNADIVIGFTPGTPVIDKKMVDMMNRNGMIIDGGIGTIFEGTIEHAKKKGIRAIRLDIRAGFSGAITTVIETENFIKNVIGHKKIDGIDVVAGGFIGKRGNIIVDNISNPTKVIGVANGEGGVLGPIFSKEHIKNLEKIRKRIEK
jgi:hypothetical protein